VPLAAGQRRVEDGLLPTHLFHALYFDHAAGAVILNPTIGRPTRAWDTATGARAWPPLAPA
jgi:hypothetical protein